MCTYSDKVVERCCDTIYSLIDDEELDHVKFLRGVSLIESLSERYVGLLNNSSTTYAKVQVVDTFNLKLDNLTKSIKQD